MVVEKRKKASPTTKQNSTSLSGNTSPKQSDESNKNNSNQNSSSSNASSIISRAAQGVRHLMGIQMVTRALTFILNVAILRAVDRSVAGANGVQLQLVLALILSLSRDVARRVYSRISSSSGDDKDNDSASSLRRVSNTAWISVAISAAAAPAACLFALRTEPVPPPQPAGSYATAVWIFGVAALIESLSEPASCAAQFEQRYAIRLRVESLGAIARCVLSFVLVKYVALNPHSPVSMSPLVCLALGQVSFAVVLLVGYSIDAVRHNALFFPGYVRDKAKNKEFVGKDISKLVAVYEWQAVQKVVLTEGEKIVLVLATSATSVVKDSEAIYSLVNNLCSLVVRFIFQPIEEVCFTAFGRLASSGNSAAAAKVLVIVLRLMIILGACFVCFGPAYSHFAIDFLYTSKYSETEAPRVLAWYCVYILLVAVNGTTEAFVHSVASEAELRFFNLLLIGFSAVFVISASVFIRIPAIATVGLVWANCVNMGMRIISSCWYIAKWIGKRNSEKMTTKKNEKDEEKNEKGEEKKKMDSEMCPELKSALPSITVISVLVLCFAITMASYANVKNIIVHLGVGVMCFFGFAASIILCERKLLSDLKDLWKGEI